MPDAYTATIPYLLEQGHDSTWTICVGSAGDTALRAAPAMTQGALYSFAKAAALENASSNIRFNEMYTNMRVETDKVAVQHGTVKSSEYAQAYELLLDDTSVRGCRVTISNLEQIKKLHYEPKI